MSLVSDPETGYLLAALWFGGWALLLMAWGIRRHLNDAHEETTR